MNPFVTHTQRGFTLLELAVVLIVLSIIAVFTIPNLAEDSKTRATNLTIGEIQFISEAARIFAARRNFGNGEWPDQANNCANAIDTMIATPDFPFQGIDQQSPYGTTYVTACDNLGTFFQVAIETEEEHNGIIINSLPATVRDAANEDITITHVPLPGSVPALEEVLHRRFDPRNPQFNEAETQLRINSDPATGSTFALISRDEVGRENAELENEQGSLSVNDIFLRSRDQFVSNITATNFIFITPRQVADCGINCNEVVNAGALANDDDTVKVAIVNVRMCARTNDLGGFNTYTATFVGKDDHRQSFDYVLGVRSDEGVDTGADICNSFQAFVPVEDNETFRVQTNNAPRIVREQTDVTMIGYIR